MEINKTSFAANRSEWRAWLEQHHATEREVWVVYYKATTGKPGVTYEDSVQEALCFGWVDSNIQKIDEEKFVRRFTPRKPGSKWAESNKNRVVQLIREGRMTAAGLATVDFSLPEADVRRPKRPELPLPDWLKTGLMASPKAWENFSKLPPSHRRNYIAWISDAKREETRQRRIREAIKMLENNERLGMK
jgi:uncharacterized protein YdeI (YjbR/CyaY-like superfamily)